MKRRVLLVDDEVAVLLTLKAVLEISGFDVETAASSREARLKLRSQEYHLVITDMRMESDAAGSEVIAAARTAPYHPAVALLTAFPIAEEDWQEMGAHHMLVKPMHTRLLLEQIDRLMESHTRKLAALKPAEAPALSKTRTATATKAPTAKKASTARKPIKATKPAVSARRPRAVKSASRTRSKS